MGGRGTSANSKGFKVGATPTSIDLSKKYNVVSVTNSKTGFTKKTNNAVSGKEARKILKGYTYNGAFWGKSGTNTLHKVVEV